MTVGKRYRADLARYMAECDANYIRLLKLIPELESLSGKQPGITQCSGKESVFADGVWHFKISADTGEVRPLTVRVRLLEVFPYTATLEFAAQTGFSGWAVAPVIGVRIYHDAATAEVVSYQGEGVFWLRYSTPNRKMYHQNEKEQVNRFLGEWLNLCLSAGSSMESPDILQTV